MATRPKTPEPQIVVPSSGVELIQRPGVVTADDLMPVLDIRRAIERRNYMVEVTKSVMKEGVDYGTIPGTDKPTLLKPGAERLCSLFGLSPKLYEQAVIEDWLGESYGDQPFFYYRYLIRLIRNRIVFGEGIGSCNSRESKFRYRQAQRLCPSCGRATIMRGKEEWGGGWFCFAKKGGCGEKFKTGDERIENQAAGRVLNPDICDLVNNMQKMAYKRSLVGAVLIATNASEFFTQDVEDMEIIDLPVEEASSEPQSAAPPRPKAPPPPPRSAPPPEPPAQPWSNYNAMINAFGDLHGRLANVAPDTHDAIYHNVLASFEVKHSNEFRNYKTASTCYKTLLAKVEQLEREQREKQQQQPQAAPSPQPEAEEDF